jgi:hypothetical protein
MSCCDPRVKGYLTPCTRKLCHCLLCFLHAASLILYGTVSHNWKPL